MEPGDHGHYGLAVLHVEQEQTPETGLVTVLLLQMEEQTVLEVELRLLHAT